MIPHKKSEWLEGGEACLECSEDWPCRDMRIWQSGYSAGLEEVRHEMNSSISWHGLLMWLDAKLKDCSARLKQELRGMRKQHDGTRTQQNAQSELADGEEEAEHLP